MPVAYKGVRSCRGSASGWCWGMYRGVILEFMRREGVRFGAWEREVYAEILFGLLPSNAERCEMRDAWDLVPACWACAVSGWFFPNLRVRSWLPLRLCLITSSCDSRNCNTRSTLQLFVSSCLHRLASDYTRPTPHSVAQRLGSCQIRRRRVRRPISTGHYTSDTRVVD